MTNLLIGNKQKIDFILQLFKFSKKGFAFHIKKDSYTN